MAITYDVRVWKTEVFKGKRGSSYRVRWIVDGKPCKRAFKLEALADSFRADLVAAARKGEAFDVESGLPVSVRRTARDMTWYEFACAYVDMKWPHIAATTRRTHAEAFTAFTVQMLTTARGKPNDKALRSALCRWGFNTARRNDEGCPAEMRAALKWAASHTRPVSSLASPEVLRPLLDSLRVRLDGKPAASSVISRRRKILNAAVEYAVELKLLTGNPLPALKWRAPKPVQGVDPRCVPNPVQVRRLLAGVRDQGRVGRRLVAFFGCLYYAAMRPEEAAHLNVRHLALPPRKPGDGQSIQECVDALLGGVSVGYGWGEFHLDGAEPYAGREWTDSGKARDRRQLKQRERGESRTAPCPPELTALIHAHLQEFGTTPDGHLFVGDRNHQELPKLTVVRVWKRARQAAFAPEVAASPLARRPYDLRHAAVSTWLSGGVSPTDVAAWAGQSTEILFRIYAKCLDGGKEHLRRRVEAALGYQPDRAQPPGQPDTETKRAEAAPGSAEGDCPAP
jgi:integrase